MQSPVWALKTWWNIRFLTTTTKQLSEAGSPELPKMAPSATAPSSRWTHLCPFPQPAIQQWAHGHTKKWRGQRESGSWPHHGETRARGRNITLSCHDRQFTCPPTYIKPLWNTPALREHSGWDIAPPAPPSYRLSQFVYSTRLGLLGKCHTTESPTHHTSGLPFRKTIRLNPHGETKLQNQIKGNKCESGIHRSAHEAFLKALSMYGRLLASLSKLGRTGQRHLPAHPSVLDPRSNLQLKYQGTQESRLSPEGIRSFSVFLFVCRRWCKRQPSVFGRTLSCHPKIAVIGS
jgi:hypothetical protein